MFEAVIHSTLQIIFRHKSLLKVFFIVLFNVFFLYKHDCVDMCTVGTDALTFLKLDHKQQMVKTPLHSLFILEGVMSRPHPNYTI